MHYEYELLNLLKLMFRWNESNGGMLFCLVGLTCGCFHIDYIATSSLRIWVLALFDLFNLIAFKKNLNNNFLFKLKYEQRKTFILP